MLHLGLYIAPVSEAHSYSQTHLYDRSIHILGELLHRGPPGLDLVHTGRTSTVQVLVQLETRLSGRSQSC